MLHYSKRFGCLPLRSAPRPPGTHFSDFDYVDEEYFISGIAAGAVLADAGACHHEDHRGHDHHDDDDDHHHDSY
jgi:hypothetical protein